MANLLVVDDDVDMVEAFAAVLHGLGHTARLAHDGREGLARLCEEKPDLIFCDVEMPELSGPEMAAEIMLRDAGYEQIPIVLASGVADLRHVAATVGTPYYLAKPFTVTQLVAKLNQALAERQSPRPAKRPEIAPS